MSNDNTSLRGWERIRPAFFLALIQNSAAILDAFSVTMLPITARHFTESATVIGVMVATNRFFGFLVQPYVASLSDQRRNRWGRRRPYLLFSLPVTILSVLMLGIMPLLISPDAHRTLLAIAAVFIINVILQAFLDVSYGVLEPLYGDTFKGKELRFAAQWRHCVSLAFGLLMGYVLIPAADRNELIPYVGCAVLQLVGWLIVCFWLREDPALPLAPIERHTPWKPIMGLREPATARLAVIAAAVLCSGVVGGMLHSLFVTETLKLSMANLGQMGVFCIILAAGLTYPCGWLIDHLGARAVIGIGMVVGVIGSLFTFAFVHSLAGLYVSLVFSVVASVFQWMSITPLLFGSIPAERRGEIYGSVQATRAAAATVLTLVGGYLAAVFSSYRACYLLSAAIGLIGLWATLLPPGSFTKPLAESGARA